ncbi:MAG: DinB family protein [Rhodothermales bacterium]
MTEAADLREALLDQLAYLIDEIEALKAVIDRVPVPLLEARPPNGDPSLKETYGLLATLDEEVYLPRLQQMMAQDEPAFDPVDEATLAERAGWNDHPIELILERVQDARRALLVFLRALPPEAWTHTGRFGERRRDVYSLAHHITQHDVDLLRTVGYRLYESNLLTR